MAPGAAISICDLALMKIYKDSASPSSHNGLFQLFSLGITHKCKEQASVINSPSRMQPSP